MTSRDFCYFLQGYFEVSGETSVGPNATQIIKNHLNMVFKHEIDPSHGDAAHQKKLSDVHQGLPSAPPGFLAGIPGNPSLIESMMNC